MVRDAAASDTHTGKLSIEDSSPLNQEVPASILSNSIDILVCIEFSPVVTSPPSLGTTSVTLISFLLGVVLYLLRRNLG